MGRPNFCDRIAAKAKVEAEALEAARRAEASSRVQDTNPNTDGTATEPNLNLIDPPEPTLIASGAREVVMGVRPPDSSLAQNRDKDKGKEKRGPNQKCAVVNKGKAPIKEKAPKR